MTQEIAGSTETAKLPIIGEDMVLEDLGGEASLPPELRQRVETANKLAEERLRILPTYLSSEQIKLIEAYRLDPLLVPVNLREATKILVEDQLGIEQQRGQLSPDVDPSLYDPVTEQSLPETPDQLLQP